MASSRPRASSSRRPRSAHARRFPGGYATPDAALGVVACYNGILGSNRWTQGRHEFMNEPHQHDQGDAATAAASGFQILEAQDIEIVSIATGRRVSLDVAVREGWTICEHCGSPYDPADVELLRADDEQAGCISDVCRHRRQALTTAPLPIERILVFARTRMHHEFHQGVLYRLFYEHDEQHIHPHFALRDTRTEEATPSATPQPEPTIREENWLNRGLVLTKRKRGRFVSWVPIGVPEPTSAPPPASDTPTSGPSATSEGSA